MITHEQEIEIKNKMIEAKNDHIVKLEMEIERLRNELGYIANAKWSDAEGADKFLYWAQTRARHALGQKPGELSIKKGKQ